MVTGEGIEPPYHGSMLAFKKYAVNVFSGLGVETRTLIVGLEDLCPNPLNDTKMLILLMNFHILTS